MYNDGTYMLNIDPSSVCNKFFDNLISMYSYDYYDEDEDESDYEGSAVFLKSQLIQAITVIYGGYAAQEAIFGEVSDNTKEYLQYADSILDSMSESGMLGLGLRYSENRERNGIEYTKEKITLINQAYDEITNECYRKAKEIINNNVDLIKGLMPILMENSTLGHDEVREALESLGGIKGEVK